MLLQQPALLPAHADRPRSALPADLTGSAVMLSSPNHQCNDVVLHRELFGLRDVRNTICRGILSERPALGPPSASASATRILQRDPAQLAGTQNARDQDGQPMRLYYHPLSSNSRRVLLTAHHLGLNLELVIVDLSEVEHKTSEY
jgi:hypothetical protein